MIAHTSSTSDSSQSNSSSIEERTQEQAQGTNAINKQSSDNDDNFNRNNNNKDNTEKEVEDKSDDDDGDNSDGENSTSEVKSVAGGDKAKRFLPAYKKANAALTFPEKMMNLMKFVDEANKTEKDFCISWLPEGKAFVIYNIKEFTSHVIPKFFKASKFCSFTRKLYRWGFRQLNRGIGPDEPIIFGNEYFQRDNADLMVNMRSITAASIRKRESDLLRHMLASKKRALLQDRPGGGYMPSAHGHGHHQDGGATAAAASAKQQQFNNMAAQFDQKQNASRVANVLASQQRFGGGSGADGCYSTNLSHLNNQELQMMYQSVIDQSRKSSVGNGVGGGADVGGGGSINPIISDAVSQMSNMPYGNFNTGGSQHPAHAHAHSTHQQEFNAMTSMQHAMGGGNNSSSVGCGVGGSSMVGQASNFMNSHSGSQHGGVGNNSSFDAVSGNGSNLNANMQRMNNAMVGGNSYGGNGVGGFNGLNVNGVGGFNTNNMFASDSMYGNNGSVRGNGNFNHLSQQFGNPGANCGELGNLNSGRKNLMSGHSSKHNYDNGNYSNFNSAPVNSMNINQQLFNLSSSTAPGGGSDDLYFGGQY